MVVVGAQNTRYVATQPLSVRLASGVDMCCPKLTDPGRTPCANEDRVLLGESIYPISGSTMIIVA